MSVMDVLEAVATGFVLLGFVFGVPFAMMILFP